MPIKPPKITIHADQIEMLPLSAIKPYAKNHTRAVCTFAETREERMKPKRKPKRVRPKDWLGKAGQARDAAE